MTGPTGGVSTAVLIYATGIPVSPLIDAVFISSIVTESTDDYIGMGSNATVTNLGVLNQDIVLTTAGIVDFAFSPPRDMTLTGISAILSGLTVDLALLVTSITLSVRVFIENGIDTGTFVYSGLGADFVFGTAPGNISLTLTDGNVHSSGTSTVPVVQFQRVLLVARITAISPFPLAQLETAIISPNGISAGITYM
jgi:hypothetical protein